MGFYGFDNDSDFNEYRLLNESQDSDSGTKKSEVSNSSESRKYVGYGGSGRSRKGMDYAEKEKEEKAEEEKNKQEQKEGFWERSLRLYFDIEGKGIPLHIRILQVLTCLLIFFLLIWWANSCSEAERQRAEEEKERRLMELLEQYELQKKERDTATVCVPAYEEADVFQKSERSDWRWELSDDEEYNDDSWEYDPDEPDYDYDFDEY